MITRDHIDMKGRLSIRIFNQDGKMIRTVGHDNAIVTEGRDLVAKLFIGEDIDPISHIAIGTGDIEVDPAEDNTLTSEVLRKEIDRMEISKIEEVVDEEQNLTVERVRVTLSTDLNFDEGNDALSEAGLFNAADGGAMYNRVVFPTINKTSNFKLTLVWEIIF